MEDDLKLRLLYEASASGLLAQLSLDPFRPQEMTLLNTVLSRLRDNIYQRTMEREFLVSLIRQVCMAIGNRDHYDMVRDQTQELLKSLREMDFPEDGQKPNRNEHEDIIDLWVQIFGDPVEVERQVLSRLEGEGQGQSDKAQSARDRKTFVQSHYLRGK